MKEGKRNSVPRGAERVGGPINELPITRTSACFLPSPTSLADDGWRQQISMARCTERHES